MLTARSHVHGSRLLWSQGLRFAGVCLACGLVGTSEIGGSAATPPVIQVRSRTVLTVAGQQFRDANGSGTLDPYEDWRLTVGERVADLLARMTLDEKAGLMLIDTIGPGAAAR